MSALEITIDGHVLFDDENSSQLLEFFCGPSAAYTCLTALLTLVSPLNFCVFVGSWVLRMTTAVGYVYIACTIRFRTLKLAGFI